MAIDVQELLDVMKKNASYHELRKNMTSPQIEIEEPVKEFKSDFELDDDGEEYMSVGTNGLLAASEKLLAMNRGLVDQDERDSLRYQKIIRPAGMFRERIKMDSKKLSRQVMYQAARRRNLSGLLPYAFDGYIDDVLKGNPLTSPLEEINPMQLVENARRITKMGPGGIPSSDSITEEAQAVHPSQFGFIDIIAGPECLVDNDEYKTRILTKEGWKRINSITEQDEIACNIEDKLAYHKPTKVTHEHYEGDIYCVNTGDIAFAITPTHRVVFKDHRDSTINILYAKYLASSDIETVYIPTGLDMENNIAITSEDWSISNNYSDDVHCVTVPGSCIYLSVNDCPGFWSGNSERAGIDVRAAWGTKVGSNGRIYQKFYDRNKKKEVWLNAGDISNLVMKIPD